MPDHRLAKCGAGALVGALMLSGCSITGIRRSPATGSAGASGRPPVALTQMDAAAVAIFNTATPYNRGTSGASAQDTIGRTKPTTPTGTPGSARSGAGTGIPSTAAGTATPTATVAPGATTTPSATGSAPGAGGGTTATRSGTTATGTSRSGSGKTAQPGSATASTPSAGTTAVDWGLIDKGLSTVAQSWTQVRGDVGNRGASKDLVTAVNTEVSRLTTAVHGRSPLTAAMAANDLTGYDAALLGLYRPGTPVQIYQMEFMAREIELDVEAGRTEAALDLARSLAGVWSALRGPAMARSKGHAAAIAGDVGLLAKAGAENLTLNLRSESATLLRDLHTLTRDFVTATG